MSYWTALQVVRQAAGELGLPLPTVVTGSTDIQAIQLLSLLNSAGNELMLYYPWEQFRKEWVLPTVDGQSEYDLPDDYNYLVDQTQWDGTNHWPLLGPKSSQEWAYLKNSLVAALPRLRYRIVGNKLVLFPTPDAVYSLSFEYVRKYWVDPAVGADTDMITADADYLLYNPWLLVKYIKFKLFELKGLPTAGPSTDFMRVFNSLTGKDVGASVLSLSPQTTSQFIGAQSIPDGSWNVLGT